MAGPPDQAGDALLAGLTTLAQGLAGINALRDLMERPRLARSGAAPDEPAEPPAGLVSLARRLEEALAQAPAVDVSLDELQEDRRLQVRERLDPANLARLCASDPREWPPLVVADQSGLLLLLDGFHRLEAARRLGLSRLPAKIVRLDDGEAAGRLLHLIGAALNARHGLPLRKVELARAALAACRAGLAPSIRSAARYFGVSEAFVRKIAASGGSAQAEEDPERAFRRRLSGLLRTLEMLIEGAGGPEALAAELVEFVEGRGADPEALALLRRFAGSLEKNLS